MQLVESGCFSMPLWYLAHKEQHHRWVRFQSEGWLKPFLNVQVSKLKPPRYELGHGNLVSDPRADMYCHN